MLVTIVNATIPRISSMIAAPRIALPERVLSFPSSFNVSTVILTEVAVRITPIKIFCRKILADASDSIIPGRLNKYAVANPPASGTSTPQSAIIKDAFPHALSSLISVSIPAQNIRTTTPISATDCRNDVSVRMPTPAGPNSNPARSAPTTCGICTLLVKSPSAFVQSKIIARSSKYL